jgi:hypothetical protein
MSLPPDQETREALVGLVAAVALIEATRICLDLGVLPAPVVFR